MLSLKVEFAVQLFVQNNGQIKQIKIDLFKSYSRLPYWMYLW